MAHQWTRINLASTTFPFESDFWGRSIMLPQYDTNFDFITQRGQPDLNRGVPQAFYMHNCMPTAQGYQAIGYEEILSPLPGVNTFDRAFPLEYTLPQVAKFLFAPAAGKNYVYDANVGIWESMGVLGSVGSSSAGTQTQAFSATASTYVDETTVLTPGAVLSSLGSYLTSGISTAITLQVVEQNSSGNYTVVASCSGTHLGAGWQDFAITYTVPTTGTYMLAIYLPTSAVYNYNINVNFAVYAGLATGTETWTETTASGTAQCPTIRASTATPFTAPQNAFVTVAFVNGKTYIYYQNIGCMYYDQTAKVMQTVALCGLLASDIKGICSANGYMVAWDEVSVVWSNTANPEDFVPSLTTGAGGGPVQFINGKIQFGLTISGGFLLYCERNVVSASYTANVRYPYIFAEVAGSGGCQSPDEVTWQGNLAAHYAWTTAGIQQLNAGSAKSLFGEATDFLAGFSFEDFDETALSLSLTYLSSPVNTKLAVVGERYAVISYGVSYPDFTHALVYDMTLARWGKLKITHRACFEWNAPSVYGSVTYGLLTDTPYGNLSNTTYGNLIGEGVAVPEVAKKNLAFLQADGTVQIVNFDISEEAATGVIILGKFQFERNKFLIHQRTDVENVLYGNRFAMYLIPTLNGKDLLTPVEVKPSVSGQMMQRFAKRLTGQNISLLFIGAFNLTSVLIDFMMGGDR